MAVLMEDSTMAFLCWEALHDSWWVFNKKVNEETLKASVKGMYASHSASVHINKTLTETYPDSWGVSHHFLYHFLACTQLFTTTTLHLNLSSLQICQQKNLHKLSYSYLIQIGWIGSDSLNSKHADPTDFVWNGSKPSDEYLLCRYKGAKGKNEEEFRMGSW